MKNKFYLALVFSILFVFTGCSSSGDSKITADTKISFTPTVEATPEIIANSVVAEVPIKETPAVESVKAAFVISDNANLRKIGNSEGEVIDTIPEGTNLEVLRQKGAWFFVRVDEKTGWLHGDTIRFGDAPIENESYGYTPTETYVQPITVSEPPPLIVYSAPITPTPTPEAVKTPVPVEEWEPKVQRETEAYRNSGNSPARVDAPSYPTVPTAPSYPTYPSSPSSPSYTPSYDSSPGTVQVRGYTRKDGTYVAPHTRTKGDSTTLNNWSTKGNVNPYTGKRGSRKP